MSTLVAQTISNGTVSTSTANVINGAKAWVNFNGTTSPGTIRASYNVSSVTKQGTGQYTVNFTNNIADANYSAVVSADNTADSVFANLANSSLTTSSFRIFTIGISSGSATYRDPPFVCASVFR